MPIHVTVEKVWEDGDATLLRRVDMDGVYITQATIASIQRTITDVTDPAAPDEIDDSPVEVAEAVFDTLQTDGRWKRDVIGYNFRDTVPGTLLTGPAKLYQVEYKFTGSGGQVFWVVFKLLTLPICAS